jgi:hypothetical protein
LRYAGEFSGFRIAAGIGYQDRSDVVNNAGDIDTSAVLRGESEWSAALSVMHVPSGLFAQGHYARGNDVGTSFGPTLATPAGFGDARIWLIQAGITKNWFGLGNTSLYGEYGNATDYAKGGVGPAPVLQSNLLTSDTTIYGIGIVQQIDSAAMELYLGWRRFNVDLGVVGVGNIAEDQLDLVHGGARIRF